MTPVTTKSHSTRLDELEESRDGHTDRIRNAEKIMVEDHLALGALLERVDYLEAQTRDAETDRYVELRRLIKVIALTERLVERGARADAEGIIIDRHDITKEEWRHACAVLFERYGHLRFDGKLLWSKPPAPPSPQTKALIAESLRRRQES